MLMLDDLIVFVTGRLNFEPWRDKIRLIWNEAVLVVFIWFDWRIAPIDIIIIYDTVR